MIENEQQRTFLGGSMVDRNTDIKDKKEKERDISLNRFEYIYKNKINPHLEEKN